MSYADLRGDRRATTVAIWATIWATCDTARLVRAEREGPADRGAGLLDAMAGLARCPVLRWRASVRASCRLDAGRLRLSPVAPGARCPAVRTKAPAMFADLLARCLLSCPLSPILMVHRGLDNAIHEQRRCTHPL